MSAMTEVLSLYRTGGCPPMEAPEGVRFESTLAAAATDDEIRTAWGDRVFTDRPLMETAELWREAREAYLFRDVTYGQWGLHLLPPAVAAELTHAEQGFRPDEHRPDDIVLGEFLGDTDLLVLAPSEPDPARRLLVAMPIDPRAEWYAVGPGLADFLRQLCTAGGEKFWEDRGQWPTWPGSGVADPARKPISE